MCECFACIYAIFYLSAYWLERLLKCGGSQVREVSYLWATVWVWGIELSFFVRIASVWTAEPAVQWWHRLVILFTHEAKAEVHRIKDCSVSWWVHSDPEQLSEMLSYNEHWRYGDIYLRVMDWPSFTPSTGKTGSEGRAIVASHGKIWFKIQCFVKKSHFSRGSKVATD